MSIDKAPMPDSEAYNAWNAERMRIYRQNMTEEQKEHRRAYQRAYYRANKEQHLAYDREYKRVITEEQKERRRAYDREYRRKRRESTNGETKKP